MLFYAADHFYLKFCLAKIKTYESEYVLDNLRLLGKCCFLVSETLSLFGKLVCLNDPESYPGRQVKG